MASVFTWGKHWHNKQIIINTDNLAITDIWKTGSSKDPDIMPLICALFLFFAKNNINILMEHISGHHNHLSDSLSRLQVGKFRQLHPEAAHQPTTISPATYMGPILSDLRIV